MASIPASAQRRPQRPLPTAPADADILGIGQGRDFRFTSPEAQQTWLREAYKQAVNADTWHLGDKVDDKVSDAILAGVGGAQPPMYRGPDRQSYFQNARTMEDPATRSHRARYLAGSTQNQIGAGMPGENEYVAMREAQSARAVAAARQAYAANDNESRIHPAGAAASSAVNGNRLAGAHCKGTAISLDTNTSSPPPTKFPSMGMAFLPRIPIDSPSAKAEIDRRNADSKRPAEDYSSPEAAVYSLYGMSPGIQRTILWPDPRGPDGEFTSDLSQWTAPQMLYDSVRAFVAPDVVRHGGLVSDADALNLALTITGGGLGAARAGPRGGVGMPWAASGRVPRELAKTSGETVEFFYNPTPKELADQLKLSEMKTLRALRLKNGKILTWPAEKSLHPDAIERLIAEGVITEADLAGAERLFYDADVGFHAVY